MTQHTSNDEDYSGLVADIRASARNLGFQQVRITDTELDQHRQRFRRWLAQDYHGEMDYMASRAALREEPQQLQPGVLRVISFRMDYLPAEQDMLAILARPQQAYISRYALGRDYHKLIRKRLAGIARQIETQVADSACRAFVDSAPLLERAFAEKAGLGWIGKNTMLINSRAGSWFFLGEILTNLALPTDPPQQTEHCGSCQACLDICPTKAFVGPWVLDARRCISYLTIELRGSIPLELRPLLGNRVFGCDDCQICCPWNKFTSATQEADFQPRHGLDNRSLLELFSWDEQTFLQRTAGSAIRRIGYTNWLRNLSTGLGNAPYDPAIVRALQARRTRHGAMLDEHIDWALQQQAARQADQTAS